jgi:hypothetical protein
MKVCFLTHSNDSDLRPFLDVPEPDADTHVRNPMLGERAWFLPYDPSLPPIHVCEAACTAFATRLRKVLTKSETTSHMPRTQYTPEATLMKIRNPAMQWPSLAQARLLVQIVFNQVTRVYHLVLRKSTIDQLEAAYREGNFDDPVLSCKFFALFALGEVYSARSIPSLECNVPGVAYYVNAMTMIPILPERPSLAHIESLLLLVSNLPLPLQIVYILTISVPVFVLLEPTPFGISVGRQRHASRVDCGSQSQHPRKQVPRPCAASASDQTMVGNICLRPNVRLEGRLADPNCRRGHLR